jgi:hypothetical protein
MVQEVVNYLTLQLSKIKQLKTNFSDKSCPTTCQMRIRIRKKKNSLIELHPKDRAQHKPGTMFHLSTILVVICRNRPFT